MGLVCRRGGKIERKEIEVWLTGHAWRRVATLLPYVSITIENQIIPGLSKDKGLKMETQKCQT